MGIFCNGYMGFGWNNFADKTKLSKRTVKLNNRWVVVFGFIVHKDIVPLVYYPDLTRGTMVRIAIKIAGSRTWRF